MTMREWQKGANAVKITDLAIFSKLIFLAQVIQIILNAKPNKNNEKKSWTD